jgi:hypothetical protein
MTLGDRFGRACRGAVAATVLSGLGLAGIHQPAQADGISPGAAVGIGLGAFALGTMTGTAPYYGNPYGGYYGPAYYPPPPAYYAPYGYAPRSCWSPYYGRYVPC